MIFNIGSREGAGIFLSEILVNPVAHYPYFLIFALDDGEIVQHHEQFDIGHHLLVHILPVVGSGQYSLCPRMVYDMMDIVRLELVEDGDGNRTIRQYAEKADGPVRRISSDQSYFVSFLYSCMFEYYMKFFDTPGHIFIMVRVSIII